MNPKRILAVTVSAAAIALLTSCAALLPPAQSPKPSLTATPTPPPEPEPLPAVSLETTCGLLFGSNVDGPAVDATDIITRFVEAPDLSTITEDEVRATIESLETAGKNADERLKPYIEAQITPLKQLEAAFAGTNSNVDFSDYKASALEMVNKCDPYL